MRFLMGSRYKRGLRRNIGAFPARHRAFPDAAGEVSLHAIHSEFISAYDGRESGTGQPDKSWLLSGHDGKRRTSGPASAFPGQAGFEKPRRLVGGQRLALEVALHLVAPDSLHVGLLLLGLDAFGDHAEAQAVRERYDRLDDREILRVARYVLDERAVDL